MSQSGIGSVNSRQEHPCSLHITSVTVRYRLSQFKAGTPMFPPYHQCYSQVSAQSHNQSRNNHAPFTPVSQSGIGSVNSRQKQPCSLHTSVTFRYRLSQFKAETAMFPSHQRHIQVSAQSIQGRNSHVPFTPASHSGIGSVNSRQKQPCSLHTSVTFRYRLSQFKAETAMFPSHQRHIQVSAQSIQGRNSHVPFTPASHSGIGSVNSRQKQPCSLHTSVTFRYRLSQFKAETAMFPSHQRHIQVCRHNMHDQTFDSSLTPLSRISYLPVLSGATTAYLNVEVASHHRLGQAVRHSGHTATVVSKQWQLVHFSLW